MRRDTSRNHGDEFREPRLDGAITQGWAPGRSKHNALYVKRREKLV